MVLYKNAGNLPVLNNLLEGIKMSETMDSVFNALAAEPYGVIDDRVLSALRLMFEGRDVEEIGAMRVIGLSNEIVARREAAGFPEGVLAREVARDLLGYMREMEFVGFPQNSSPNPEPQTIKLVQDKTPRDMNLRELLDALAADPSRYSELVQYIDVLPEIRRATAKSPNWAVTVAGQKSRLDIGATLKRVDDLMSHTIVQAKLSDGRYPTLLARVFGREERFMLNPFANSLAEAAIRGPIFGDYDLGNLAEEVHLAYIWAAFVQGHQAWPKQIDQYDHIPPAFQTELSGRWAEIVADFRAAKENGDPSTEGLTRYMDSSALRGRRPFVGSPQRDEAWYREQLERRAGGRGINQSMTSVKLGRRIVRSIRTSNASISLEDTIVLGDVITSNARIKGCGYVIAGATVYTSNSRITPDIYEMSYEGLYNKAVELGIIQE